MRFSERMGIKKVSDIIQKESMDKDLRTDLWNMFFLFREKEYISDFDDKLQKLLYIHFFKRSLYGRSYYNFTTEIENYIKNEKWFEVYDLIEFIIKVLSQTSWHHQPADLLKKLFNSVLKRNNSAYRFVDDEIAPITDDMEIKEIETAQENALSNVQTHINTALGLLSDRQKPDYRNSIKESISAVEALCREITGESTLDRALPALKKEGVSIPKMLRQSFEKFYHFTNGENGIRHALMDEEQVDFEEAKYMLVLCSAFINYIQGKKAKS